MIWRRSKQHLAEVGERYFEHMRQALGFAIKMQGASLAAMVHAICPGCFQNTGSRTIFGLNAILRARAGRAASSRPPHDV